MSKHFVINYTQPINKPISAQLKALSVINKSTVQPFLQCTYKPVTLCKTKIVELPACSPRKPTVVKVEVRH